MKDSMKMTVGYQFAYILLMQLAASGVTLVFGLVAFWYFLNMRIVKEIVSIAFMGVNFAMLYIASKNMAKRDGKSYTPLKQNKIKGALFGAAVSAVTLVLMLIFLYVWSHYSDETGIKGVVPMVVNIVFYCWSFPYNGIMGLFHGQFTVYSGIIMLILPIAATAAGYIAGCKNIELAEKLDRFIYEKE